MSDQPSNPPPTEPQPDEPEPDQEGDQEGSRRAGASSHDTAGQFPADDVAGEGQGAADDQD